jgi:AcrR family transcriptional regulator
VRGKLVEAGLETLHAKGFNGCSVQDITEAAGVPKGSFFNHFKTKEALALEVLGPYGESSRIDMLFERFVSKERNEPPDIDIDFEHERREEVIQYIYGKYGRDRAALTAEVITYRGRSAIREVGKALGLSLDCVDTLAKSLDWWERVAGITREQRADGKEEKRTAAFAGRLREIVASLLDRKLALILQQRR